MTRQEIFGRSFLSKVLWLLIIQSMFPRLNSKNPTTICIGSERAALLTFKAGLTDPRNILSSWKGEDCCTWWGVACNNKTGHVMGLNLRGTNTDLYSGNWSGDLGGELNPSLLHLKHLRRLDLSLNNFADTSIPEFFGSLENLRYLNLSEAGFAGQIPPQLGNLTRLRYLDFCDSIFEINPPLHVDNLRWLQHLSSLKHLDMTQVNLTAAVDWLYMVNMIPSLTFLKLKACGLYFIPSYLPYNNLTTLNTLDLGYNNFNDTLPQWLWNITGLANLNLYSGAFYGPISDAIGKFTSLEVLMLKQNDFDGMLPSVRNLCSLNTLDLSSNKFSGEIDELVERLPNCTKPRLQILRLSSNMFSGKLKRGLERMVSLNILDLVNNQLDGSIPDEIGKLMQLIYLDLSVNSFKGVVTEAHFANLTRLKWLFLSYNPLVISMDGSRAPSFQLNVIGLHSCQVGPSFPVWLRHQKEVFGLDLSNSGISGAVPEWFWKDFPLSIEYLDLSNNQISGKLPESLEFARGSEIFLSSNQFEGPLPQSLPYNTSILDLSNNSFSGPLLNIESPNLNMLDLSNNLFNSSIPSFWRKVRSLMYLDLSENNFSGEIPNEWPDVTMINLGNNRLSGKIPRSMGSLTSLEILKLGNNSLSGLFPAFFQPYIPLFFLDLSQNKFYGSIPTWIRESLPFLYILLLRSNMFSGNIPPQLVQLQYLRILDLAGNNLSGPIPQHLGNLSAMALVTEKILLPDFFTNTKVPTFYKRYYIGSSVFTKGEELEYTKNRYLVKSVDLSDNQLRGVIPEEIGALIGLINLNLSANHFEGKIPKEMGRLQSLESLDLSRNELSGNIPLSISSMNSLSHLNLSYNHLSGRIPSGNQLQTLNDPSIYAGNIDLCGPPLPNNCSNNKIFDDGNGGYDGDEDGDEMVWLYLGMGLGYVVGFWSFCGVLFLKKTWRYAYFRLVDNVYDQLYLLVSLNVVKLKRATMERN